MDSRCSRRGEETAPQRGSAVVIGALVNLLGTGCRGQIKRWTPGLEHRGTGGVGEGRMQAMARSGSLPVPDPTTREGSAAYRGCAQQRDGERAG